MEVGLIILLFVSNALALDCLYNHRIKTTGALLILKFMFDSCFSFINLSKWRKSFIYY